MPPAHPPRQLQVGRLALLLDGADLRYVSRDGTELIRRIYVAVRDREWTTLEPDETRVEVEEAAGERIEIRAAARHASAAATLSWTVRADIAADGALSYGVELRPEAEFDYMRMGICLLLPPATVIGRPFLAGTAGGELRGELGTAIAPQVFVAGEPTPMFASFSSLNFELGGGRGELDLRFDGDLFEMEDQRNWSDGSLKVYGTPLSEPRPRHAAPGQQVRQRVDLAAGAGAVDAPVRASAVEIEVATEPTGNTVPGLGTTLPPERIDDPVAVGARLRGLGLEHLRVDLRDPAAAAERLERGAALASAAGARLALAIYPDDAGALPVLGELLAPHAATIARLLVLAPRQPLTPAPLLAAAREQLFTALPAAELLAGTDLWFVELNRESLEPGGADGIAWPVSPQVHCSDELTMVEALEPQADQVGTARTLAPGLGLHVGPVTLRPRFNPAAADAWGEAINPPPASVDPRQGSLFAAAWTAASLAQLCGAGADSVTYFESSGPRAALDPDGAGVHPCWHPLADVGGWRGWQVLQTRSSNPLAAQALVVRDASGGAGALIANLRAEPTAVRLAGLPAGLGRLRTLDADTRALAGTDPDRFRQSTEAIQPADGILELKLGPHAVAALTS